MVVDNLQNLCVITKYFVCNYILIEFVCKYKIIFKINYLLLRLLLYFYYYQFYYE